MLTQERLKELLDYHPDTGLFFWKKPTTNRTKKGSRAGYIDKRDGYMTIRVDGVLYQAAHLAILYMQGKLPTQRVKHLGGDRLDCRAHMLKPVSVSCTMQSCKMSRRNKSGYNGVVFYQRDSNWKSAIGLNGKTFYLGYFDTPEAAAIQRLRFEILSPDWSCDHTQRLKRTLHKIDPAIRWEAFISAVHEQADEVIEQYPPKARRYLREA